MRFYILVSFLLVGLAACTSPDSPADLRFQGEIPMDGKLILSQ